MTNEHILVVEDEEDILELLRYNLAKEGFRVRGVTSGEEALRSAKTIIPVSDRFVDVQVVGLRKKLSPAGQFVETVRGVGYRLKE